MVTEAVEGPIEETTLVDKVTTLVNSLITLPHLVRLPTKTLSMVPVIDVALVTYHPNVPTVIHPLYVTNPHPTLLVTTPHPLLPHGILTHVLTATFHPT